MATNVETFTSAKIGLSECLEQMALRDNSVSWPLSTYRLQFNKDFRFTDALAILPYLRRLGVTHVYSSPILKARAGSTHGYDITDHNLINPEIGSEEEFQTFVTELKRLGMGQILDTVPNHMGVGLGDNPWWRDVLENGQASEYADFFDIDWDPLKPELRNKILLPVLGNSYGEELEEGRIQIAYSDRKFLLHYYDKTFPLDPRSLPKIYGTVSKEDENHPDMHRLQRLIADLSNLPNHSESQPDLVSARRDRASRISAQLNELIANSARMSELTASALQSINGRAGVTESFDALHALLEAQAYRLAHWRVSAEEINYRRFFDINELVGLRMENPRVFAETHRLLRRLMSDGSISGVRIDHCDGLLNPRQYLIRLQMLHAASQCCGPEAVPPLSENGIEADVQRSFGHIEGMERRAQLYTVVEKILEPGEQLPTEWPVNGTSGYDFANLVNGIFIQQESERDFTNTYHRFIGAISDFDELIYDSKALIMNTALSSEVNVLTHMLDELSSTNRRARDFTRKTLRDAIRETIACFPVYRAYVDERGEVNDRDREYVDTAIRLAKRRNAGTAAAVFDFLRDILLLTPAEQSVTDGHTNGHLRNGFWKGPAYDLHRRKLDFTLKFQQLTGPVMAKGLEDTVCFVYNRFVSLNEVGGSPKIFGRSMEEFHRENIYRAERWPGALLALSTHDTKRSEDVRARLNVLSEFPRQWSSQVMRWKRVNQSKKITLADGRIVPDANEEYLLYQTLLGTWPLEMESVEDVSGKEFLGRIQQYMTKCLHEAKVNLSWINPDPEYVDGVCKFIENVLTPASRGRSQLFLDSIKSVLSVIHYFGMINSLAQKVLQLTSPGIPDVYQGTDLWDSSLVDPDNRRPVDYSHRTHLLESESAPADLLANYQDGRIKLFTTTRTLCLRRDHPELFLESEYSIPAIAGDKPQHVCAFMRSTGDKTLIVAVPRFAHTLMKGKIAPPLGEAWGNTRIRVPSLSGKAFKNIFTGAEITIREDGLQCRDVFDSFPIAVLMAT